jgi:hypothetical protein
MTRPGGENPLTPRNVDDAAGGFDGSYSGADVDHGAGGARLLCRVVPRRDRNGRFPGHCAF